ncbi:MAG: hypothetical protein ACK5MZ_07855 [Aestuariibaculum sp.]
MKNHLNRQGSLFFKFFFIFIPILVINAQHRDWDSNIEKIYIHTDRDHYTIGETLWYKAYSVLAQNNLMYNKGNVLYVELISPKKEIVVQNKTFLRNGLGHGDFKITDSLFTKTGTYQLRAYTNWNRNFGDDFVFKKNIEILDVFETKNQNTTTINLISESGQNSINTCQNFKIQFFPEGGNLIEGVTSIVAFKAEDLNGNPINVTGRVLDSGGKLISFLSSFHDGMGTFKIKPNIKEQYTANIETLNGSKIKISLPKVSKQGYLLSVQKNKDKVFISAKTNQETLLSQPNATLTIICSSQGTTYFEGVLPPLKSTSSSIELPITNLPEGIAQITLYDSSNIPQSERLFYIEKEHDLEITLTTDKSVYKPNEKINVNITSQTKAGKPVAASLSLSAVDFGTLGNNENTNICSYFLIESDIKGTIHNPTYYFNPNNPNRLEFLDLLLLTQGWRDFIWKTSPKKSKQNYKAEYGFDISGFTKHSNSTKPMVNNVVSLTLINKYGINILKDTTDTLGRFKFENIITVGETSLFLASKNSKGEKNGNIILNNSSIPSLPVHFSSDTLYGKIHKINNTIKENMYKKYVAFGITPKHLLDTVKIMATKKEETPNYYGPADRTYVVDDTWPSFTDIFELLRYAVPNIIITNEQKIVFSRFSNSSFNSGEEIAHIVIDGVFAYEQIGLESVHPTDVKTIEVFKENSASFFGLNGAYGAIVITTKQRKSSYTNKKVKGSIAKKIDGFYDARVFYVSDSENKNRESDIRNTLYWNPYVHPNKNGVFQTSYFNSNIKTKVKINLQGLTQNGIPVVKTIDYKIE